MHLSWYHGSIIINFILIILQLKVGVMDNGYPQKNSSTAARVRLRVTRNKNAPRFDSESYEKAIPETQQASSSVFDINAQDSDAQGPFKTITYSLIGDDAAPTFFEIETETGLIKVRRDLRTENVDFYNVSEPSMLKSQHLICFNSPW